MNPTSGKRAGNIAVVLTATLVGLGLAEAGLRLFAGDLAKEPVTGNQYVFYRYDPELGWANAPGVRGTFERGEFSYEISINTHALRGPEIAAKKPVGVRRIAVQGDSFTWGIGASESELFTTLLARSLPKSEVLNFGVSGYGPVQYLLQAREVLAMDPDVVVIAFCLGNDFADNVFWQRYRYYKPFARLDESGELVIDGYPIPSAQRFPSSHADGLKKALYDGSYLFRLLDKTLSGLAGRLGSNGQKGPGGFAEDQSDIYRRPESPEVAAVVRINGKVFERIVATYGARGIPVIVLAAPTKCEFGACFKDLTTPSQAARQALQRSLRGTAVTIVDPTDELTLDDFWVKDAHWRPAGHRKIADALLPYVSAALGRRQAGANGVLPADARR
jgi:lysophospholipase L1-like esterase